MNIKRFNESHEDFLEEVENVFSYMTDSYSIKIEKSSIDKHINVYINKLDESRQNALYLDLFIYIDMLKDVEECLKKLSIGSPVYYRYYDYDEDMLIVLDRVNFGKSCIEIKY